MPADDGSAVEPESEADVLEAVVESSGAAGGQGVLDDRRLERTAGNWLTTGIKDLDRYLGGGIPPGRLVAFVAPANTQGELFVKQIAAEHDSLYLTSLRPRWEVEETVRDHVQRAGRLGADQVSTRVRDLDPDDRLADARRHVGELGDRSIVVVDSADELEAEPGSDYVGFLNELKRRLWDTGSVGLLHCFDRDGDRAGRRVTLRMADVVWELRRSVEPGNVEYLLVVSKFRGGRALTEPVKLELTNEVRIDTSRDIA